MQYGQIIVDNIYLPASCHRIARVPPCSTEIAPLEFVPYSKAALVGPAHLRRAAIAPIGAVTNLGRRETTILEVLACGLTFYCDRLCNFFIVSPRHAWRPIRLARYCCLRSSWARSICFRTPRNRSHALYDRCLARSTGGIRNQWARTYINQRPSAAHLEG